MDLHCNVTIDKGQDEGSNVKIEVYDGRLFTLASISLVFVLYQGFIYIVFRYKFLIL